ncbi:phenylacetaldoxime dehydratase family protein [Aspergillus clavatus NRRL 1]|uniref:Phenylacetaldoxime dehydratase family protein, putative n=1 Tax=Aspergillus clavatus (strain ATCC 1007 / CBS 513.65 / DSM 816 / NCTC 3887 / NRRL 1 / QM 1276 / 107) TaxID=344612 RepID=A1CFW9_ASPCL|nr:phenylacetaldoxime dehydratase family protein, putative [Aspergillus clavatus NRRL 1]EAW11768.1 phenylacetaldoxime dehydratase family protein, putative [Aspergillus clavatus NRRL 1]
MSCGRVYPLRQPKGYKPPVPRWLVQFPSGLERVYTAYIGVQDRESCANGQPIHNKAYQDAVEAIQTWITADPSIAASSVEQFEVLDGDDTPGSTVWACYWDDAAKYEASLQRLNLVAPFEQLDSTNRQSIGLWCERFTTRLSRLETNYSGSDYLPGLARLPGVSCLEHTLATYWGSARDRIPDSATELFEREEVDDHALKARSSPVSLKHYVVGTNPENIVHIRSGQFWANCNDDETKAYKETLEPALRAGLKYLWEHPVQTGASGLRYLANRPGPAQSANTAQDSRETCVAGFFRTLSDLENWAKSHPSHLAIYTGAVRHAKKFGEQSWFRAWHEIAILKRGEAQFEYVNCVIEANQCHSAR